MKTVNYFEIVVISYHGEPVGKLRFTDDDLIKESPLYCLKEVNNMITCWRMGSLWAFGHDTILADDAIFQLVEG